jgi:hypothetical protein
MTKRVGRIESTNCCRCHVKRKASNRSYCKTCWAIHVKEYRQRKAQPLLAK